MCDAPGDRSVQQHTGFVDLHRHSERMQWRAWLPGRFSPFDNLHYEFVVVKHAIFSPLSSSFLDSDGKLRRSLYRSSFLFASCVGMLFCELYYCTLLSNCVCLQCGCPGLLVFRSSARFQTLEKCRFYRELTVDAKSHRSRAQHASTQ